MFDLVMSAILEYVDEAVDIALDIGIRIRYGIPNICLGSEIDDDIEEPPLANSFLKILF